MDKKQLIQDKEYQYPYHYIPKLEENNFSQTQYWSWGYRYLGGIKVVLDNLENKKFKSLIDLGCGDGRFLREVQKYYPECEICGIDYSEKAIKLAQALNPGITFQSLNIIEEVINKKYDIATAIEVLEHIPPKDLQKFIKSTYSLLNKNGLFILTVPHENKNLQDKHYQHFSSIKLESLLSEFFDKIEFIPFDVRSRLFGQIPKLMGGKGYNYVITNKKINNWFFNLYKNNYLYADREDKCLRIAAICKKEY